MKWSRTIRTPLLLAFVVGSVGLSAQAANRVKTERSKHKASSQSEILSELKSDPKPSVAAVNDDLDIELDEDEVAEPTLPKPVADAIANATKLEEKKQYAAVVTTLKPVVAQLPRHGVLMLSRAYRSTGNIQGELQMLDLLLAKNASDYVVKTQEADALLKLKRTDEAIAAYQAAKAINKQYKPAYEGLWQALEKAKDMYEARSVLTDMVKIFGPTAKSQSTLCRLFSTEDFLEKTVEHCRKAIELDPKNPDNYVHLGLSLRDQEKTDEAVKVLGDAAKRFPRSESVQSTAGELKASKKDFGDAYELFKVATKADAKSSRAWLGFAKSAHELQKYSEAISGFTKACKLDRRTSIHFRSAASDLKRAGNAVWPQKYLDAELECE